MQTLLDLPVDILSLVAENLVVRDFLNFCASCQAIWRLFRPEKLVWLVKNPEGDTVAREQAVVDSSYLVRCHALHRLFLKHGLACNYAVLFKHGASFKPVPHGDILHATFHAYGPGAILDFLLDHGASFDCVPGGMNKLFEETVRYHGPGERTDFLSQRGAKLCDAPCALETLVDDLIAHRAPWEWVEFAIDNSRPLRYAPKRVEEKLKDTYRAERLNDRVRYLLAHIPNALCILLEDTLSRQGFGPDVDMLLREGGSFVQTTSTATVEGDNGLLTRAVLEADVDLTMTDQHGWTPLYRAAGLGCTEIAKCLVKKGAPLNDGDRDRRTPLYAAALQGYHETVAWLLDAGADHTVTNRASGSTPLHIAAYRGQLEATKVLAACADLDCRNKDGWTPLFFAAYYGFQEIVKFLLDAGADPCAENHDGVTPIHAAAANAQAETVVIFLNWGVNPERYTALADGGAETPLHIAASSGHLEVVKALIKHGANLTTATDAGLTAIDVAAVNGHTEVVRFLLGSNVEAHNEPEGRRTALHWACQNGQLDVAKFLIEQHANPSVKDDNKLTPIYIAAANGHPEVVRFLIEQPQVDPDAGICDGHTPLWTAAVNGHVDVLKLLIDQRVRVDPETDDGMPPLYMAAARGYVDVVKILVENQADPSARAADGMTALHMACAFDNLEMAEVLVEHKADVNAAAKDGLMPLHAATAIHSLDIMRLLIQHKGDVNAKALCGLSPLHVSAVNGRLDEIELLLEQKVDLSAKDHNGCTPLCCASREGELDVVKRLVKELASSGTDLSVAPPQDDFHRTPLHWAVYRRHPVVAKFLVESGIDTKITDGYGKTALDWACRDGAMFHDIIHANYQATAESTQLQVIGQSVVSLSQRLLDGNLKSIPAGFHDLGHCLVLLKDSRSACFCFQQQLATRTAADDPIHHSICETCTNESESEPTHRLRFICTVCPDVTLCATHIKTTSFCRNHEFLEVPPHTPDDVRGWEVINKMPINVQEFLRGLINRYDCEPKV